VVSVRLLIKTAAINTKGTMLIRIKCLKYELDIIESILKEFENLMNEYATALAYILPRSVAAVLVLVIGWLVGRLLGKLVAATIRLSKAEDAFKGTPFGAYLSKAGFSFSSFIDTLVRAIVYVFTVALAVRALKMPEAEAVAQALFSIVGRVAAGVLVLVVGVLLVEKMFEILGRVPLDGAMARLAVSTVHAVSLLLVVAAALAAAGVDLSPLASVALAIAQGVGIGLGFSIVLVALALYWEELSKLLNSLRRLRG